MKITNWRFFENSFRFEGNSDKSSIKPMTDEDCSRTFVYLEGKIRGIVKDLSIRLTNLLK